MIYKKLILLVALFVAVGVTIVGTSAYTNAVEGKDGGTTTKYTMPDKLRTKTITVLKTEIRQEVTANLENRETNRQTKLETKRLQICQNHQQKINDIFSHATEQNEKHLAVFRDIQTKVEKFYTDNNLSSEDYAGAVAKADGLEFKATAAIEVSTETTFDCETTYSTNPGQVIKSTMEIRHSSLKAYRTSIKDLILIVKKANSEKNAVDTSTTENQ